MRNTMFVLILAASLVLAACGGSATATLTPSATPTPTPTPTFDPYYGMGPCVETEGFRLVSAAYEPGYKSCNFEIVPLVIPTATPTLSNSEEMNNLFATVEATNWTQVQVGRYSESVEADGKTWELVMGTHFAVSTANGRYEAVESSPVGVVGNTDHGWCNPGQIGCPSHGLLVRVEVPEQFASCTNVVMDIPWRVQLETDCGGVVPVRISVRENDVTRTVGELLADYLAFAGLEQKVQNATSEVGLFVSVKETGMSEMDYGAAVIPFGYSCWDCLADTMGVDEPQPVPLIGSNISNFGPGTPPTGNSLLSGVVFPLPRPSAKAFELSFELEVAPATPLTVWAGRYDAQSAASATPAPTATVTPAP